MQCFSTSVLEKSQNILYISINLHFYIIKADCFFLLPKLELMYENEVPQTKCFQKSTAKVKGL